MAKARRPSRSPGKAPPATALPRIAKGKKPQYFSDPAIDKLLWMNLTLMEELSVTRDRLDVLERLLAKKRVLKLAEIDQWRPGPEALDVRNQRRAAYVARMLRAMQRELEELTRADMPASEAEMVAAVEA